MSNTAAASVTLTVQCPIGLVARIDEVRAARQRQAPGRSVSRSAVLREALEALVSPAAPIAPQPVRVRSRKPDLTEAA